MNFTYQRWNGNPHSIGERFFTFRKNERRKVSVYPTQTMQERLLDMGIPPKFPKAKYIHLPPHIYQRILSSWRKELRIALDWLRVEDRLRRDIEATRRFREARKKVGKVIQVNFQQHQDLDLAQEA